MVYISDTKILAEIGAILGSLSLQELCTVLRCTPQASCVGVRYGRIVVKQEQ
jgi:hypothetical protein